jgi:hypothetical protein
MDARRPLKTRNRITRGSRVADEAEAVRIEQIGEQRRVLG